LVEITRLLVQSIKLKLKGQNVTGRKEYQKLLKVFLHTRTNKHTIKKRSKNGELEVLDELKLQYYINLGKTAFFPHSTKAPSGPNLPQCRLFTITLRHTTVGM